MKSIFSTQLITQTVLLSTTPIIAAMLCYIVRGAVKCLTAPATTHPLHFAHPEMPDDVENMSKAYDTDLYLEFLLRWAQEGLIRVYESYSSFVAVMLLLNTIADLIISRARHLKLLWWSSWIQSDDTSSSASIGSTILSKEGNSRSTQSHILYLSTVRRIFIYIARLLLYYSLCYLFYIAFFVGITCMLHAYSVSLHKAVDLGMEMVAHQDQAYKTSLPRGELLFHHHVTSMSNLPSGLLNTGPRGLDRRKLYTEDIVHDVINIIEIQYHPISDPMGPIYLELTADKNTAYLYTKNGYVDIFNTSDITNLININFTRCDSNIVVLAGAENVLYMTANRPALRKMDAFLQTLAGPTDTQILKPEDGDDADLDLSNYQVSSLPNSNVVFLSLKTGLYYLNLDVLCHKQIMTFSDDNAPVLAQSQDGTLILVGRAGILHVVNVTDGISPITLADYTYDGLAVSVVISSDKKTFFLLRFLGYEDSQSSIAILTLDAVDISTSSSPDCTSSVDIKGLYLDVSVLIMILLSNDKTLLIPNSAGTVVVDLSDLANLAPISSRVYSQSNGVATAADGVHAFTVGESSFKTVELYCNYEIDNYQNYILDFETQEPTNFVIPQAKFAVSPDGKTVFFAGENLLDIYDTSSANWIYSTSIHHHQAYQL